MWPLFAVSKVAGTDRTPLEEFCKTQTKVRDGAEEDRLSYHIIECLQEWYPADQESSRIHLSKIQELLRTTKDTLVDDTKTIGDVLRQLELTVKQAHPLPRRLRSGLARTRRTGGVWRSPERRWRSW
jgi:hypothetical protein